MENYQKTIDDMREKMRGVYEGVFEFAKCDRTEVNKQFKGNLRVETIDNQCLRGYTLVCNEMEFFTWIIQSGGRYKLVGPEEACSKINQMPNQY